MAQREPHVTFLEMLDAAHKARWVFESHRREELDSDWESAFALRLALQILGEAANRLPANLQAAEPQIAWAEIIGLRNILVHGYDTIDLDILWKIAEKDLPPLISRLEGLLGDTPR